MENYAYVSRKDGGMNDETALRHRKAQTSGVGRKKCNETKRALKIKEKETHVSFFLFFFSKHNKNRPHNREGIIEKVDGVRMHVSLSDVVSCLLSEGGRRERKKEEEAYGASSFSRCRFFFETQCRFFFVFFFSFSVPRLFFPP